MHPRWFSNFLVVKQGIKLLICFLPPLKCWDYRTCATDLVYAMLGIEPKALGVLGKKSAN